MNNNNHPSTLNTTIMPPSSPLSLSPPTRRRFILPDVQIIELFVALLVFVFIRSLSQRRRNGLPTWPFVGMLPSLVLGLRVDMYEWISQILCRQNGTFLFKGPWFTNLNCVVTSDPRNVEHLLKTRFQAYPKGPYFRHALRDLLGDGILTRMMKFGKNKGRPLASSFIRLSFGT
ncbi:putative alkane 1-monooxygenase [Helianthus annuus]|nr:putative alkane 1-monooxygenase [Helianthus annuus]